jgi:fibulin 1/2
MDVAVMVGQNNSSTENYVLFSFADINECTEGTDQCAQNCHNSIGSYTCSCDAGYTLNANGRGCDDIDECTLGTDQCSQNCQNTVGSYTCSCNTGYRLNTDGRRCDGKSVPFVCCTGLTLYNCFQTLMSAWKTQISVLKTAITPLVLTPAAVGLDTHSMLMGEAVRVRMRLCFSPCNFEDTLSLDINECLLGTHTCGQICNNTIGSYVCDCRVGYRLNPDRRGCDGV